MLKLVQVGVAALAQTTRPVTIEAAAWLAGRWVGEGFGGEMEEAWSPPIGGQMIGHFRHWRDGQPAFYEFLILDVVEGGVRMRVKHFSPDGRAWEEAERWLTFEPVSASPDALIFEGLAIRRTGADTMEMTLRMRRGETVSDEILRFRRAPL